MSAEIILIIVTFCTGVIKEERMKERPVAPTVQACVKKMEHCLEQRARHSRNTELVEDVNYCVSNGDF